MNTFTTQSLLKLVAAALLLSVQQTASAEFSPSQTAAFLGDQLPDPTQPWWLANDLFGAAVDIDGTTAVVGARKEGLGTVYIYEWDGSAWLFEQKLELEGTDHINFGRSVGISGDTIIVGEIDGSDYQGTGSAYVYVREPTGWVMQQQLFGFTPEMSNPYMDGFGLYVDIDADTAIVAAWHDDDMAIPGEITPNTGAIHVFVRENGVWTREAKIFADDVEGNQHFGRGLVIEGDTILVSSLSDRNDQGLIVGSAYVFVRKDGQWVWRDKLEPSDPQGGLQFGLDMSINGDTFLISAVGDDSEVLDNGAAYIFERDGCTISEVAKLKASDTQSAKQFGGDVYLSGDLAIIGAMNDNQVATQSGAAYVFKRVGGQWTEIGKVITDDAAAAQRFGTAVSVHGDMLVGGSLFDLNGKTYMFDLGEGNVHAAPSTRVCFDGCHPE